MISKRKHGNISVLESSNAALVDYGMNTLCDRAGLIKSKVLESIGDTIENYLSKKSRNAIPDGQIKALHKELLSISDSLKKYAASIDSSKDHYDLIMRLTSDVPIKKNKIIELVGENRGFLQHKIRRQKLLDIGQKERLKVGLIALANEIKRSAREGL